MSIVKINYTKGKCMIHRWENSKFYAKLKYCPKCDSYNDEAEHISVKINFREIKWGELAIKVFAGIAIFVAVTAVILAIQFLIKQMS